MNSLKSKIFILIIIFLIFYPVIRCKNSNIIYEETSKWENVSILCEITPDTLISQPIYIYKENIVLDSYSVMFANYNNRENKGKIKIELVQGNAVDSYIIDVKNIKDNQYANFELDFNKFDEGKAIINIVGIDTEIGSSVGIYISNANNAIGNASLNEILQSQPLTQKIVYSYINSEQLFIKVIMYLFLILFTMLLCFCLLLENSKFNYIPFVCCTGIIFLSIVIRYPSLLANEPFAETVTNFYHNAKIKSFLENLFILDAGYLPLLQHLIAWIFVRIFHTGKYSILFMQIFSLLFISSICSLFSLKLFDKYLSAYERVIFCILLPTILLFSYENYTFINFVYFGLIFILLIYNINLDILNKYVYILLVSLGVIICLSKGFYIILIPTSIFYFIIFFRKVSWRYFIYNMTILISSFIQVLFSFDNKSLWLSNSGISIFSSLKNFISFIFNTIFLYSRIFIEVLGINIAEEPAIYLIGIIFLTITLFIPLINWLIKKNDKMNMLIFLNLVALASSAFCTLTLPYLLNYRKLIKNRHESFLIISICFIIIMSLHYFKEYLDVVDAKLIKNYNVYFSLAILFIVLANFPKNYSTETLIQQNSDWNNYYKYTNYDKFAVPILPNKWIYGKNSNLICFTNNPDNVQLNISKQNIKLLDIKESITKISLNDINNLELIGVYAVRTISNIENLESKTRVVLKDSNGNIIDEILQTSNINKLFTGYLFEDSVSGIHSLEFYDENNNSIYVKPEIYVIIGI